MKAVIAGSFDPFTLGHLGLVKEALRIFESVRILVPEEIEGKKYLFDLYQRKNIIKLSTAGLPVKIETLRGLYLRI